VDKNRNEGLAKFQTFYLECGNLRPIRTSLLDRFLACMKPASTT
jgi:hypothetical protein